VSNPPLFEIEGALHLTVDGADVQVCAEGSVVTVSVPDAHAARKVMAGLPAVPSPSLLQGLKMLSRHGMKVRLVVAGAQVAELGDEDGLLPAVFGLRGVKVDFWRAFKTMVEARLS